MNHDIVVVGTSAGGIEAISKLFAQLDPALPASYFVVLHMSPRSPGLVPDLLRRSTRLEVRTAENGEVFRPGVVYFPPPDYHLKFSANLIALSKGPRENFSRPSIDVLFRSAAVQFGSRVIGVVLTGQLRDGTSGMRAVLRCGGLGVVQDPADASYPDMPRSVLDSIEINHVVPIERMREVLRGLIELPAGPKVRVPEELQQEERAMESGMTPAVTPGSPEPYGQSVGLSCPDCGGPLFSATTEPGAVEFRCLVGHKANGEALVERQMIEYERSLWAAIRVLRERAALFRSLAINARTFPIHRLES